MRATLALALLLLVAACRKDKPAEATSSAGSGSAGSGSSADPCPPQAEEFSRRAMDATEVYFTALASVIEPWTDTTECAAIHAALVPLAPAAETYAEVVNSAKDWMKSISEECRDSLDKRWSGERRAKLDAKFKTITGHGMQQVKRCQEYPGMEETAAAALKLMKKRR